MTKELALGSRLRKYPINNMATNEWQSQEMSGS